MKIPDAEFKRMICSSKDTALYEIENSFKNGDKVSPANIYYMLTNKCDDDIIYVMKLFSEYKVSLDYKYREYTYPYRYLHLLEYAYKKGSLYAEVMLENGASPEYDGYSILNDACKKNNISMVNTALKYNANPNYIDKYGFTAFQYAFIFNCTEIMNILVKHGADSKNYYENLLNKVCRNYNFNIIQSVFENLKKIYPDINFLNMKDKNDKIPIQYVDERFRKKHFIWMYSDDKCQQEYLQKICRIFIENNPTMDIDIVENLSQEIQMMYYKNAYQKSQEHVKKLEEQLLTQIKYHPSNDEFKNLEQKFYNSKST